MVYQISFAQNEREVEELKKEFPQLEQLMKRQIREHEAILRKYANPIDEAFNDALEDGYMPVFEHNPRRAGDWKARRLAEIQELRERHNQEYEALRKSVNGPYRGDFMVIYEDI